MKTNKFIAIRYCFALVLFYQVSEAQSWIDKTCPGLDKEVNLVEFETSKQRNVLEITINQSEELVINAKAMPELSSEIKFKEYILEFVTNPSKDKTKAENPNKVYIRLNSYNKSSSKLNTLDAFIKDVYVYMWDTEAKSKYDSNYKDLVCKKREKINKTIPLRIVSEHSSKPKTNTRPKNRGVGLPPFGGDVKQ